MPLTRIQTSAAMVLLVIGQAFGGDLVGPPARVAQAVPIFYRWRPLKYGYALPVYPPVAYATPFYGTPNYVPLPTPAPSATLPAGPEQIPFAPTLVPGTRPTIVIGYQGRYFSGTITLRPGARSERRLDVTPPQQPADTFRYDGGPAQPVPMPPPDPVNPTDPVPNTVPALHRVMLERSRSDVTYPAFGGRPVIKDSSLVRQPGR
ncbi:MAG TPA: hypothetical protein VGF55_27000 [Gemmataceae bacterium]|jgi:hypothetical protein